MIPFFDPLVHVKHLRNIGGAFRMIDIDQLVDGEVVSFDFIRRFRENKLYFLFVGSLLFVRAALISSKQVLHFQMVHDASCILVKVYRLKKWGKLSFPSCECLSIIF